MTSGSQEQSSFLKEFLKILTHNFGLKILSLLFAIVLFFIVRTDKDLSFEKIAKIKLITSPNMIIIGPSERSLDLIIRQQSSIFSVSPSEVQLTGEIDILSETPGRVRVKISRENFPHLPKHYTVFIERPYLDVDIDKIQEKILPIQTVLKGDPQNGFMIDSVKVVPSHVKVSGARQELARTQNLFTLPIIIEGIHRNLETDANIELEETSSISAIDKNVHVLIAVAPKKFQRLFRAVPIELQGIYKKLPSRIQMRPNTIDIEISGERDILNKVGPSDVRVFLNTSDLKAGWQDKKIKIRMPKNLSLVKAIPDMILVHLNP
jgi:YbbR domain-containing protein